MIATVAQCVVLLDDPAALACQGGRPWFGWVLREFMRFGVTDFLLLTGLGDIRDAITGLQAVVPRPVRITSSVQPAGVGSGGALFHVRDLLWDRFLLCEAPLDWNLARLLADGAKDDAAVIGRIGLGDGAMSRGIGLFRRSLEDHLRPACSLEADVLPALETMGRLRQTEVAGPVPASRFSVVSDPGPARPLLSAANRDGAVRAEPNHGTGIWFRRKALFLDRDGVLNIDHGYVGSHDRFEWVDGALDAVRHATQAGWHVFIVTNQSGVARGHYTEAAVRDLLDWISDMARAAGGTIDDWRFCPYHPEAAVEAYRQAHPWRKPLPGMLLDLMRAWDVDPTQAVMVGDQETDMLAAAAAGVAGHLFPGGNLFTFVRSIIDGHESRFSSAKLTAG